MSVVPSKDERREPGTGDNDPGVSGEPDAATDAAVGSASPKDVRDAGARVGRAGAKNSKPVSHAAGGASGAPHIMSGGSKNLQDAVSKLPRGNRSGKSSTGGKQHAQGYSKSAQETKESARFLILKLNVAYWLSLPLACKSDTFVMPIGAWLFGILIRHIEFAALQADSNILPGRAEGIEAICPPLGVSLMVNASASHIRLMPDYCFVTFMRGLRKHFIDYFMATSKKERFTAVSNKIYQYMKDVEAVLRTGETFKVHDVPYSKLIGQLALSVPECCIRVASTQGSGSTVIGPSFKPWCESSSRGFVYFEHDRLAMVGEHILELSASYLGVLYCAYEFARQFKHTSVTLHRDYLISTCQYYTDGPMSRDPRSMPLTGTVLFQTTQPLLILMPQANRATISTYMNPTQFAEPRNFYKCFRDSHGPPANTLCHSPIPNDCRFIGLTNDIDAEKQRVSAINIPFILELPEFSVMRVKHDSMLAAFSSYFSRFTSNEAEGFFASQLRDKACDVSGFYSTSFKPVTSDTVHSRISIINSFIKEDDDKGYVSQSDAEFSYLKGDVTDGKN